MTSVMLATYPDAFAGGAIIAGLPYGAATNVQQAFENMYQCPPRPAQVWGELVRSASSHRGPWPRISVWHGGADTTVIPSNAVEIVKQWTNVHGLSAKPSFDATVDGYPRQVWTDKTGNEVIESYTIPCMAHGTPLAAGAADHECGVAGPFLLDVGISSSYHIAKFFGLTGTDQDVQGLTLTISTIPPKRSDAEIPSATASTVLEGEILEPNLGTGSKASVLDVGAVITKALRAAGLMKNERA
jgi:feruloyl esterase